MKKRILFTGGGGAGTEALWRFLSGKYELYFADACLESIDGRIPDERKVMIPLANKKNFADEIRNICKIKGIDLIVPSVDEELLPLCENRDIGMPELFSPSTNFVRLMLDKLECAKAISLAGLSVPKTLPFKKANEIEFPMIIKPRSGRGSRGVCVIGGEEEINAYMILYKTTPEKVLLQELGVGEEYTILVAGDKSGRLRAIVPVRVKQKKGITIRAKTELNMHIINYVKKFHEIFKPSNIYNIQCILTKEGVVLPFEVNPRISTTFCLGVASGFDPFMISTDSHSDEIFLPQEDYVLERNWSNIITKC